MKLKFIPFLFVLLLSSVMFAGSPWQETLTAAQQAAKTKNKLIFFYIYNDASMDGKLIVQESFADNGINKLFNEQFILARCNIDKSSEFMPLVKRVNLYQFRLPLAMILDADGKIKSWHEGYISKESLIYYLSDAAGLPVAKQSKKVTDKELFEKGKAAYDKKEWNEALKIFYLVNEQNLPANLQYKLHIYLGLLYYINKDYDSAIDHNFRANGMQQTPDLFFNIACAYAMKSDKPAALFYLDKALKSGYKDFSSLHSDEDLQSVQGKEIDKLIALYSGDAKPIVIPQAKKPVVATGLQMNAAEQKCYDLVNAMRAEKKLPLLKFAPDLLAVARKHSLDMGTRNFFDHKNPDGKSPFDRISAAGINYNYAAENIQFSQGYADPAAVAADGWRNSPGHYHNIITPELEESAIGVAEMPDGRAFFTQVFIRRQ